MNKQVDIYQSADGILFVSTDLIEAIKSFPPICEVAHCDFTFTASSFDFYGTCPKCDSRIKLRSFSGNHELPDVFDAVFEWLVNPEAQQIFEKRLLEMKGDL